MFLNELLKLTYSELAEWTALRVAKGALCEAIKNGADFESVEIFHEFQGSFERSAELLVQLEIFKISPKSRALFLFNCPKGDIKKTSSKNMTSGPTFEELLTNFIDLASNYSTLEIRKNSAFVVHTDRKPLFDHLTQLGYIEKNNDQYVWLPKADKLMDVDTIWRGKMDIHFEGNVEFNFDHLSSLARKTLNEFARRDKKIDAIEFLMEETGLLISESQYTIEEVLFPYLWSQKEPLKPFR